MSSIARTNATGTVGMLPELLAWSSSFREDLAMAREDLLGSAAHVTMLARCGLASSADAAALRNELLSLFDGANAGTLVLPDDEEDVHMAVEAELGRRLGPVSGRLHTARSRNDQVALDLRLHVRDRASALLSEVSALALALVDRARRPEESSTILPAYTHRQRAQPISAAFLLCAWAAGLLRAGKTLAFALDRTNELALGSGACSGTSLPIDRALVGRLLGFPRVTTNALDTVGDRDFALDYAWAGARVLLSLGKLSADVVDFSTSEFGLVTLDGAIACGSSMMPQKKNPDVFELVRGKTARGIGNVVSLLTLVKGLASGYNRDQQDDREAIMGTFPLVSGALAAVAKALPHVAFVPERGRGALADGFTQATDLAEALVRRGVPFREAYKAVGELVRRALARGTALADVSVGEAKSVHSAFDATVLSALNPTAAVAAKESVGGTGPGSVANQLDALRNEASELAQVARATPTLLALAERVRGEPLEE